MKRPGTSFHQFVQRIPADIKDRVRGTRLAVPVGQATVHLAISPKAQDVRLSLRTRDPKEAKARQREVLAYLERVWATHRDGPRSLPFQEIVALSGTLYHELTSRMAAEPGEADIWRQVARLKKRALESGKLETWLGGTVDELLLREGLNLDAETRGRLLAETARSLADAAEHLQRNARGDYRPDPKGERFPKRQGEDAKPPRPTSSKGPTLQSLLASMAAQRGHAPKTVSEWTRSVQRLTTHAGTDVATEITPDQIVAWTEAMVVEGLSSKTINDTYLASIKAIFRWAREWRKIPFNPTLELPRVSRRDDEAGKRGFTRTEAETILKAADAERNVVRRWIPWLLAHTGARAGEVMQLRKHDVRQDPDSGIWIFDITPRAGRLKNKASARAIPIHPQLIAMGFIDWARRQPGERLFYEERPGEAQDGKRSSKSIAINRLGDWVRSLGIEAVATGEVSPNHGWRNRMMTELTIFNVNDVVRRRLLGHQLLGQDKPYVGKLTMGNYHEAILRLPDYLAERSKRSSP